MTTTPTSADGRCPCCKGNNWKTLEALALTQRARTQSTTTRTYSNERLRSGGTRTSELAAMYPRPARPSDYDSLATYRKSCEGEIKGAERRLADIDAACLQPEKALPNLLWRGPEAYAASFKNHARRLHVLLCYEVELARWKSTRVCLRCVATFVQANSELPRPAEMEFRFTGEERRCPHCQSYFWKDPTALAEHRERLANEALERARQQVHTAEEAERTAGSKPKPAGFFGKLRAALTPRPMSSDKARELLVTAEQVHRRAINGVRALRKQSGGDRNMRWCVKCQSIYSSAAFTRAATSASRL